MYTMQSNVAEAEEKSNDCMMPVCFQETVPFDSTTGNYPRSKLLHIHIYVPMADSLNTCSYYCSCGKKLGDIEYGLYS